MQVNKIIFFGQNCLYSLRSPYKSTTIDVPNFMYYLHTVLYECMEQILMKSQYDRLDKTNYN